MWELSNTEIGRRIRRRRWTLAITQQQLAEAVSVHFTVMQEYEAGTAEISERMLHKIADILEAPVSYFQNLDSRHPTEYGQAAIVSDGGNTEAFTSEATRFFSNQEVRQIIRCGS